VDLLEGINVWDSLNGKRIAYHCGTPRISLLQYHVLLEQARKDLDDWPLLEASKAVIVGTLSELLADSDNSPNTLMFLAHIKAAKRNIELDVWELPAAQRASLVTCLDLLIKKTGETLAIARFIVE